MGNNSGSLTCTLGCWAVAALTGVLAAALLMVLGDWSFLQAVFAGGVIFVLAGALISWLICSPLPAPYAPVAKKPAKPAAAPASAPASKAAPAPAASTGPLVKPSKALQGQAELAARRGEWSYRSEAPAQASSAGRRPEALKSARGGKADDLKKIKGIGPKLEQLCHKLGFFHFDQIAAWTAEEIAWVDDNLEGFKGRVTRDDWVAQARLLAGGGETAFSKKVDKGDVY